MAKVASGIVLPVLGRIGEAWQRGDVSVAQEHFATALLRGRMLGVGRNWGTGSGPRAILACPPTELHDLGLIAFGLLLRERGSRITFLGGDTPIETIGDAAAELSPATVVIAAVAREPFEAAADQICALAGAVPVSLGGAGADEDLANRLGAGLLDSDPVRASDFNVALARVRADHVPDHLVGHVDRQLGDSDAPRSCFAATSLRFRVSAISARDLPFASSVRICVRRP